MINKEDVYPESIIPIYLNDKLEGFAILIEMQGEELSLMRVGNKEEDGIVYLKQRWLVEWAPLTDEMGLSIEQKWTQRSLQGKRCHRYIEFQVSNSWEEYVSERGALKDKNYYERGDSRRLDDSNCVF